MSEVWSKNINDYLKAHKSSYKSMYLSLALLSLKKRGWIDSLFSLMISLVMMLLGVRFDYLSLEPIIDKILSIEISIFGIIFTIYSIILTFFSDELTKVLIRFEKQHKSSMLKEYTGYYGKLLFLIFFSIWVTMLVYFCEIGNLTTLLEALHIYNKDFILDVLQDIKQIILLLYITFSIRIIIEMRCAIYNTVCLFQLSMAVRLAALRDECHK